MHNSTPIGKSKISLQPGQSRHPAGVQSLHSIEDCGQPHVFGSGVSVTQASSAWIFSVLEVERVRSFRGLDRDFIRAPVQIGGVVNECSFDLLRGENQ